MGGTRFAGSFFAELARDAYQVTLVHRGQSAGAALSGVRHLVGERDPDAAEHVLASIEPHDILVDFSGLQARWVAASLQAARATHVLYISSISAYADDQTPGLNEEAALAEPFADYDEGHETYAGRKVACEQLLPAGSCIVRPGVIAGPRDPTDRFTYWPHRIARGGTTLAPLPREQPIQLIDARDLAAFVMKLVDERVSGAFDAVGEITTLGTLIDTCTQVVGANAAQVVWRDDLEEAGVQPWVEMPLWVGSDGPKRFFSRDNRKARAAGLSLRPLIDTARDTLEWARGRELSVGLDAEREQALLG